MTNYSFTRLLQEPIVKTKLTLKNVHDPLQWPPAAMGTPKEGQGFGLRRTLLYAEVQIRSPDAATGRFSASTRMGATGFDGNEEARVAC